MTAIKLDLTARDAASPLWKQIAEAVQDLAGEAEHAVFELLSISETRWASASFKGVRFDLTFEFSGADALAHGHALISALPEHEFGIPHHIVADVVATNVQRDFGRPSLRANVELLVLDDA